MEKTPLVRNGVTILDPAMDESGRFAVGPDYYRLEVGTDVTIADTDETARIIGIQVDPQTGNVFYRVEIWPDTPDRMYDTVGAVQVTT